MRPSLPAARVRFEPGFAVRLERLAARLAAQRARRESLGPAGLEGGGAELVGHRPWRAGDDPRALDAALSARMAEPWVRLTRREAGERWHVVVDASASMGAGPPGKLQRACELALGLAALGLREGARVRLTAGEGPALEIARRAALFAACARLEALEARGGAGLEALARAPGRAGGGERLVLLGDLASLAPEDLPRLARPGRALAFVAWLAPAELPPAAARAEAGDDAVEWWDPESDERLALALDDALVERYRQELDALAARFARAARSVRARSLLVPTAQALERTLEELVAP